MEIANYLQRVYQELHTHPELALEEAWTSEYVARELRELGFSVITQVGGYGVVGVLDLGSPGETLALRCDLDALPVREETEVPFASKNPGVMHACGHDSHMAIVLGACRYAAENKGKLRGRLLAIFQPAEEIVVGAKAMLAAGIFTKYRPQRLVAVHNWPSLPAGSLGLQSGALTANADLFRVVFRGVGGHGAFPHRTKDPVAMAAAGVQNAFALAAYLLQEVPGVLLLVGSGQEGAVNELHHPRFLVPQETLNTGFKALASIVEGYLKSA